MLVNEVAHGSATAANAAAGVGCWEDASDTTLGTKASGLQQWEAAWDVRQQRWYYAERRSGAASWTRPLGCFLVLPEAPPHELDKSEIERGLPPDWEAAWDETNSAFYYFNRKTNKRTWRRPKQKGASVLKRAWQFLTPRFQAPATTTTTGTETATPREPREPRPVFSPAANALSFTSPNSRTTSTAEQSSFATVRSSPAQAPSVPTPTFSERYSQQRVPPVAASDSRHHQVFALASESSTQRASPQMQSSISDKYYRPPSPFSAVASSSSSHNALTPLFDRRASPGSAASSVRGPERSTSPFVHASTTASGSAAASLPPILKRELQPPPPPTKPLKLERPPDPLAPELLRPGVSLPLPPWPRKLAFEPLACTREEDWVPSEASPPNLPLSASIQSIAEPADGGLDTCLVPTDFRVNKGLCEDAVAQPDMVSLPATETPAPLYQGSEDGFDDSCAMSVDAEAPPNDVGITVEANVQMDPEILMPILTSPGCTIALAQQRATHLLQLRLLLAVAEQLPSNEVLPVSPDFHAIVRGVIMPATALRRCSYIELVADGPQRPTWFVSHSWGTAAREVEACLAQHSKDRRLHSADGYWIHACALRPHLSSKGNLKGKNDKQVDEEAEMGSVFSWPFFHAMGACVGMVSAYGPNGTGSERLWCLFESYLALAAFCGRPLPYLHDVYAASVDGALACGLTDGFAAVDLPMWRTLSAGASTAHVASVGLLNSAVKSYEHSLGLDLVSSALSAKCERERRAPIVPLALKGLEMWPGDLRNLGCNVEDRQLLLDVLARGDGVWVSQNMAAPRAAGATIMEAFATVQARLSAVAWRNLLVAGANLEPHLKILAASRLERLSLELQGCELVTDAVVRKLANALPLVSLEALQLHLGGSRVSGEGLMAISAAFLGSKAGARCALSDFFLGVSGCQGVSGDSLQKLVAALPTTLRALQLDISCCQEVDGASIFQGLVGVLPAGLLRLSLGLWECLGVADIRAVEPFPSDLMVLRLYMRKCARIGSGFSEALRCRIPAALRNLVLDFYGCNLRDRDLQVLGEGLPRGLEALLFDCGACPDLTLDLGVRPLASCLPQTLKELELGFQGCPGLRKPDVERIVGRVLEDARTSVSCWS